MGYPQDLLEASSVRFRAPRSSRTPGSQVGSITGNPQCTTASPFNSGRKLETEGSSVAPDSPYLASTRLTQCRLSACSALTPCAWLPTSAGPSAEGVKEEVRKAKAALLWGGTRTRAAGWREST